MENLFISPDRNNHALGWQLYKNQSKELLEQMLKEWLSHCYKLAYDYLDADSFPNGTMDDYLERATQAILNQDGTIVGACYKKDDWGLRLSFRLRISSITVLFCVHVSDDEIRATMKKKRMMPVELAATPEQFKPNFPTLNTDKIEQKGFTFFYSILDNELKTFYDLTSIF